MTRISLCALLTTFHFACAGQAPDDLFDATSDNGGSGGAVSTSATTSSSGQGGEGSAQVTSTTTSSTGGGCVGETDEVLCAMASAGCGIIEAIDQCDQVREVDCGGCGGYDSCGGGGEANQCGCIANDSDSQICSNKGWACGNHDTSDSCGQPTAVSCGGCSGYDTCSGGGVCYCQAVPELTLNGCVYNGGPKLKVSSPSGYVRIAFSTTGPPPSSCNLNNSKLFSIMGSGVNLPYLGANSSGSYRICAWDGMCTAHTSNGKTVSVVVDAIGSPSCSF